MGFKMPLAPLPEGLVENDIHGLGGTVKVRHHLTLMEIGKKAEQNISCDSLGSELPQPHRG